MAFNVSTSAGSYAMEIACIGAEREVVFNESGIPGEAQPIHINASSYGCGWNATFTFEVPDTYMAKRIL